MITATAAHVITTFAINKKNIEKLASLWLEETLSPLIKSSAENGGSDLIFGCPAEYASIAIEKLNELGYDLKGYGSYDIGEEHFKQFRIYW